MSRSTFYYRSCSARKADKYEDVKKKMLEIHQKHKGRYGYRRITETLTSAGFCINHKTVSRLMKLLGIKCLVKQKKFRSYKGEVGQTVCNLLQRDFSSQIPRQKMVTDITEFSLGGEKRYLAPVLDLYNGEILGYAISKNPNTRMIMEMMHKTLKKQPQGQESILHSDQGAVYQARGFQKYLADKGIKQSMSRKANCWDNAVMENFFSILKSELLYLQNFSTMKQLVRELHKYIKYYNQERIKLKLGGLSPIKYRLEKNRS